MIVKLNSNDKLENRRNNKMKVRMAEMIVYDENTSKDDLIEKLKEYKSIKQYAGILHDKDDKKAHYHVMLKFNNSFETDNLVTMFKQFNVTKSNIAKIKGKYDDGVKYLIHQNAPSKYQYDKSEIFSNYDIDKDLQQNVNKAMQVILQFSNLEISFNKMWKSLTPEERITYKRQIDNAMSTRNINVKVEGIRNMKVIYIYGKTGAGKTTMAKWICDEILDVDYYVSSSSNDIMQDYLGQKAIILDDFRSDNLSFSDMLKFLDNHTQSTVKSRYYNKAIDCEYIIITTTQMIYEQYKEVSFDDRLQLYRRISEIYCISDNAITFHNIDMEVSKQLKKVTMTEGITLDITANDIITLYRITQKALPSVISMIQKGIDKTNQKLKANRDNNDEKL